MRSARIVWLYTVSTAVGGGWGVGRMRVTLSSCFYQTIRADDGDAGLSALYNLQTMPLLSSDHFSLSIVIYIA